MEDYIDFFYQDVERVYGDKVRAVRITELSKDTYSAHELVSSPIVEANRNNAWNDISMHQVDALMPYIGGNDIVAVDGRGPDSLDWKIGIYTTGENGPTAAKPFLSDEQSIGSESYTTIMLDKRAHDVSQSFDVSDHQYIVPKSGYYRIEGQITLTDVGTDVQPFTITSRLYNATAELEIAKHHMQVVTSSSASSLAGTTAYLTEGAAIQLQGHHTADHPLTVVPTRASTYLTIRRIR